jgi:hypothetical protein
MEWRLWDHFEQLAETVKRLVPFPKQDREMTVYNPHPILPCQPSDFPTGALSSNDGGSYLMLPSLGHEAAGLGPECGSTPPEDSKLMAELRRGSNHLALSSGRSTWESSKGKTVGPDDPHLRGIVLLLRLVEVPSYYFPLGRYPDSHSRERACSYRRTHTGRGAAQISRSDSGQEPLLGQAGLLFADELGEDDFSVADVSRAC